MIIDKSSLHNLTHAHAHSRTTSLLNTHKLTQTPHTCSNSHKHKHTSTNTHTSLLRRAELDRTGPGCTAHVPTAAHPGSVTTHCDSSEISVIINVLRGGIRNADHCVPSVILPRRDAALCHNRLDCMSLLRPHTHDLPARLALLNVVNVRSDLKMSSPGGAARALTAGRRTAW